MPVDIPARLDYLREGVRRFRNEVFPAKRELYESLAEKQVPLALFLTCGDSRIDPCALTSTEPGDIFLERTPGNIVPVYNDYAAVGVSASIEYAAVVLGVRDIVVCGHSSCGAMKALLHPEELRAVPATARWLEYAYAPLRQLNENFSHLTGPERLKRLCELNVIEQIGHLQTHPAVASRVREGTLGIHGWYYEIHSGMVEVYDRKIGNFREWV